MKSMQIESALKPSSLLSRLGPTAVVSRHEEGGVSCINVRKPVRLEHSSAKFSILNTPQKANIYVAKVRRPESKILTNINAFSESSENAPESRFVRPQINRESILTMLAVIYKYSRIYTVKGSALSIISISLLAVQSFSDFSPSFFIGVLQAILGGVFANLYVAGFNQLSDIEIDKVNKPYLVLASGELPVRIGVLITSLYAILGFCIGWSVKTWALKLGLFLWYAVGTVYSVNLPFLRWKRFPVLAALCVWSFQGAIVPILFHLHAQTSIPGRTILLSKHAIFVSAVMSVHAIVNAVLKKELDGILKDYVGRESPLYFAERLTEHYKRPNSEGPEIYLKREDLNHTGAHKINNAVAQALLAKKLGKERIIAETGAGQHGVATATVCARFGLQCIIYMGAQDMERQALNVFRMRLLGAEVRAVHSGTATLKDATSEAIRDWVTNVETTHYILGSVAGPHPYPMMVRDFHAVIGKETRKQALEKWGGKPDVLVACVGGGSNAMGLFHEFVDDKEVRLIGVEAAGHGLDSGKHAATLTLGEVGVLHGAMSYLLQDDDGQIIEPHSISAGLDYPGVGPEHSFLKDIGRAEYHSVTDEEALEAFKRLSRLEGIIPALETSHALAYLEKLCPTLPNGTKVVLNCSGRGDKDVHTAIKYLQV